MSASTETFVRVASVDDVPEGKAVTFAVIDLPGYDESLEHLEALTIAVARVGSVVYALENRCSHDNGGLAGSPVEEDAGRVQVTCPRHGGRFDLQTGKATRMPAIRPIQVFPARVRDGQVEIDFSGA